MVVTLDFAGWAMEERDLDVERIGCNEAIFALSNGHLGLRGNLDEGEPFAVAGTYLASVYERRPLPNAEPGYGYPESGQTLIDVTNGKLIRLLVDDEPFDIRYGTVLEHVRRLDLATGVLRRDVSWRSPAGQLVDIESTRLVSLTQRAVAAIEYRVTAREAPARVVLQSQLVANEPQHRSATDDPRAASNVEDVLAAVEQLGGESGSVLVHSTRLSGLMVGAGMDHEVEGPADTSTHSRCDPDLATFTATTVLGDGQSLRIVKYLAYGWSSVRSSHALRDQVTAALIAARHAGWSGLLAEQRSALDRFWTSADIELVGDPQLQFAIRYALFQLLQATVRGERRPVPAKGLTGRGYDGHTFWDAEAFIVPVLTHTLPDAARDQLRWRHSTLPQAMDRARSLGLRGASFPWRTINGDECSGYWPAGTAAFHVNAAVARATADHLACHADPELRHEIGTDLLVETARLWQSLGHVGLDGRFHIDGVTGPDEYSAIADDNVYTNLSARRNLRDAVVGVALDPRGAERLGVTPEEVAGWEAAADSIAVPFDERLGVHPQSAGFTDHQAWDFEAAGTGRYPLLAHHPYFDLYRKQVVKQADLVLAIAVEPDEFGPEQAERDFAYYEPLTVRDSSLSAGVQATVAARVGHIDLASRYLAESLLIDLWDLNDNTAEGLHLASLASGWWAIVRGFGGMRIVDGRLGFDPRLPTSVERMTFRVQFQGRVIGVDVGRTVAEYRLLAGDPLEIVHRHDIVALRDRPVTAQRGELRHVGPPPAQPPGREALRRY